MASIAETVEEIKNTVARMHRAAAENSTRIYTQEEMLALLDDVTEVLDSMLTWMQVREQGVPPMRGF